MAEQISKDYVTDPHFRLMFLRVEDFDAKKAATRLINYMEFKLKCFGQDVLARPIFMSDLDKDDQATLKSQYFFQILPVRDRAGRAVICDMQKSQHGESGWYKHTSNMVGHAGVIGCCYLHSLGAVANTEPSQAQGIFVSCIGCSSGGWGDSATGDNCCSLLCSFHPI
jgi:hypothetical protein